MKMRKKLNKIKRWFLYRLDPERRFHIVNTGLKPGYYDTDYRMLYACFSLLVDYVEKELPSMQSNKDLSPREAGLAHLDWIINYNNISEDPDQYDRMPDDQIYCAKTAKELYLWWKDEYPSYEDVDSAPDEVRGLGLEVFQEDWRKAHPKQYSAWSEWCNKSNLLEAEQMKKEDEMLRKLMKIRRSLWT